MNDAVQQPLVSENFTSEAKRQSLDDFHFPASNGWENNNGFGSATLYLKLVTYTLSLLEAKGQELKNWKVHHL